MSRENSLVLTGSYLGKIKDYTPGNGTYTKNDAIYAAFSGYIQISSSDNNNNSMGKNSNLIEIKPKKRENIAKSLKINSIVLGKVLKIKEDYVTVQILCIENEPIKSFLQGIIRKANVRTSEIDKLKIEQCYLPGDIIKARVLSYGDSHKIYLSTMENDLGVIFAKSGETNSLLVPFNWKEMISFETGLKEMRKVALPDFSFFTNEK